MLIARAFKSRSTDDIRIKNFLRKLNIRLRKKESQNKDIYLSIWKQETKVRSGTESGRRAWRQRANADQWRAGTAKDSYTDWGCAARAERRARASRPATSASSAAKRRAPRAPSPRRRTAYSDRVPPRRRARARVRVPPPQTPPRPPRQARTTWPTRPARRPRGLRWPRWSTLTSTRRVMSSSSLLRLRRRRCRDSYSQPMRRESNANAAQWECGVCPTRRRRTPTRSRRWRQWESGARRAPAEAWARPRDWRRCRTRWTSTSRATWGCPSARSTECSASAARWSAAASSRAGRRRHSPHLQRRRLLPRAAAHLLNPRAIREARLHTEDALIDMSLQNVQLNLMNLINNN